MRKTKQQGIDSSRGETEEREKRRGLFGCVDERGILLNFFFFFFNDEKLGVSVCVCVCVVFFFMCFRSGLSFGVCVETGDVRLG